MATVRGIPADPESLGVPSPSWCFCGNEAASDSLTRGILDRYLNLAHARILLLTLTRCSILHGTNDCRQVKPSNSVGEYEGEAQRRPTTFHCRVRNLTGHCESWRPSQPLH